MQQGAVGDRRPLARDTCLSHLLNDSERHGEGLRATQDGRAQGSHLDIDPRAAGLLLRVRVRAAAARCVVLLCVSRAVCVRVVAA